MGRIRWGVDGMRDVPDPAPDRSPVRRSEVRRRCLVHSVDLHSASVIGGSSTVGGICEGPLEQGRTSRPQDLRAGSTRGKGVERHSMASPGSSAGANPYGPSGGCGGGPADPPTRCSPRRAAAALPRTVRTLENRMGRPREAVGFVVPLAVTLGARDRILRLDPDRVPSAAIPSGSRSQDLRACGAKALCRRSESSPFRAMAPTLAKSPVI